MRHANAQSFRTRIVVCAAVAAAVVSAAAMLTLCGGCAAAPTPDGHVLLGFQVPNASDAKSAVGEGLSGLATAAFGPVGGLIADNAWKLTTGAGALGMMGWMRSSGRHKGWDENEDHNNPKPPRVARKPAQPAPTPAAPEVAKT